METHWGHPLKKLCKIRRVNALFWGSERPRPNPLRPPL